MMVPEGALEQSGLIRERNRLLMESEPKLLYPSEITDGYYRAKVVEGSLDRGRKDNWYLDDDRQQRFRDDSGVQHYTMSLEQLVDPDPEEDEEGEVLFEEDPDEEDATPEWDLAETGYDRFEVSEEFVRGVRDAALLSKTQARVVEWIGDGADLSHIEYSNRLADTLGCAPATARVHLRNTLAKLRDSWAVEPPERARSGIRSSSEGQRAYRYSERTSVVISGRNRVSPEDAIRALAGYEATRHLDSDWQEVTSMSGGGPAALDIDWTFERRRREYHDSMGWERTDVVLPERTRQAWLAL